MVYLRTILRWSRLCLLAVLPSLPVAAELTEAQKVHDFENLAALYAKNYAPAEWKKQLYGVDVLDIRPWLEQVRQSKTDLEFVEICLKYVASFRDTHASFGWYSGFIADSGLVVDLYGDKVLIEAVDRFLLSFFDYPIAVGDELLAVDGKPVLQFIDETYLLVSDANERKRRRAAADLLTFRPQVLLPSAGLLGESSVFQIRHQNGSVASYTINWDKSGYPVTKFGPTPSPKTSTVAAKARITNTEELQNTLWNLSEPLTAAEQRRNRLADRQGDGMDGMIRGYGSRAPIFAIPGNFTVRRGRLSADNFYTATYEVGGKRIGYLRIPSFAPSSQATALNELLAEITFFNANTDGLVVDVTRNPGGSGCYLRSLLQLLIPTRFTYTREQIRSSLSYIYSYTNSLETARLVSDAATVKALETAVAALTSAYEEGRLLTEPLGVCGLPHEVDPLLSGGQPIAYSKPLIVLTDDFSTSAADAFASVIQDNGRGLIVGMATAGAGGSVLSGWDTGFYSEAYAATTSSLLVRRGPVSYPGMPTTPYIENIGVQPDVYLDYQTPENLATSGRTFVNDFTGLMLSRLLQ